MKKNHSKAECSADAKDDDGRDDDDNVGNDTPCGETAHAAELRKDKPKRAKPAPRKRKATTDRDARRTGKSD